MASLPICRGEFFADGAIHSGFIQALKSGNKILQNRKKLYLVNSKRTEPIEDIENHFKSMILELEIKSDTSKASSSLQAKAARLLEAFRKLAETKPLFLVLDNIHFAGNSDLVLLKNIIEQYEIMLEKHEQKGLYFILAYRQESNDVSDSFAQFLKWLNETPYRVDIPLERTFRTSRGRHDPIDAGRIPPPSLSHSIFRDSGGNPLLVMIELVKNMQEQLSSDFIDELVFEQETIAISIDDRLVGLLVKRLDQLVVEAKDLLMASAVLGMIFRADELEQVCGLPDHTFLDQLLLIRNRIIEEDIYQPDFLIAFPMHNSKIPF